MVHSNTLKDRVSLQFEDEEELSLCEILNLKDPHPPRIYNLTLNPILNLAHLSFLYTRVLHFVYLTFSDIKKHKGALLCTVCLYCIRVSGTQKYCIACTHVPRPKK